MRPELAAFAARQGGLVTRRQAIAAGYRERELRTLTGNGGQWVVVRRGVYVERSRWEAAGSSYDGQAVLRDTAAHLVMTKPHLMSHDSAARAWALPMLRPARDLAHVTRKGVLGTRTEHGVKHHLSRASLIGAEAGGVPVTGMARTALDVAREHGWKNGVVTLDGALRRGVQDEELQAELTVMRNWPGITRAKAALELADPGAENPGETLARLAVGAMGMGRPRTQFPIRTPKGVAWVDALIGCHAVEFDGRVKFRRVENGGVADRPVEDVLWDERTRQNLICEEGLGMSRLVWDQLMPNQWDKTVARLLSEYTVTARRFGEVLPERLLRFADELADERERRIFGQDARRQAGQARPRIEL